ncbi:MAG TPA: hypothetical protein PK263_03240 [bacterium]|nr:hypothetical protein [bacterium]
MNKYSRTYNIDKTLYPNIFSVLKALPDEYFLGNSHAPSLRHPGGILNRATDEIIESFLSVLQKLDDLRTITEPKEKQENVKVLLRDMGGLFGHFDSFQDESYIILKSLSPVPPQDNAVGEKTVYEWLRKNGYTCASDFFGRTGNIQQLIDCFTNRLKHANQKLDYVTASVQGIHIPGFFIDELKGEEVDKIYQPVPPAQFKSTVAISFHAMLKLLLICFYELNDALEKALRKHIKVIHGVDFSKREIVKHNDKFLTVVDAVADMPEHFYPFEYRKFPRINRDGKTYQFSYPHKARIPYVGQLKVASTHTADGFTKTFNLPFFG